VREKRAWNLCVGTSGAKSHPFLTSVPISIGVPDKRCFSRPLLRYAGFLRPQCGELPLQSGVLLSQSDDLLLQLSHRGALLLLPQGCHGELLLPDGQRCHGPLQRRPLRLCDSSERLRRSLRLRCSLRLCASLPRRGSLLRATASTLCLSFPSQKHCHRGGQQHGAEEAPDLQRHDKSPFSANLDGQ
jgi:hypothetical protein